MGAEADRKIRRVELTKHRIDATLAIVRGNHTMGCLVPVKDFAPGGAGIYSKVKIDKGTLVRLSIQDLEHPPIEGRVIWCGSSAFDPGAPPTHPFRVGIDFKPADDAARDNQMTVFTHLAKLVGERST